MASQPLPSSNDPETEQPLIPSDLQDNAATTQSGEKSEKAGQGAPAPGLAPQVPPESHGDGEGFEQEEGVHYLSSIHLILLGLGVASAVFLVALDQTIVANAIPKITDDFNSVSDIGWYGSAYLLTMSALQLFYGKAYANFSVKYTFLLAILLFELGSLVCGLAPNSHALIVGRAVAGLGSSGIFAGALVMISLSVPLRIRPIFIGLMGGMFAAASVCGPVLGGVFTDRLTWRWCFYINLPFGAVSIAAVVAFFRPPERPAVSAIPIRERVRRIDWLGLLFFAPAICSLLLAVQWGGSTYPWGSGRIVGLFVVFGVLIVVFGVVEYRKQERATVPPRLITQRSVAAAAWYAFCNGAGFFLVIFYVPLWHQVIRDVSAVESGIRLLSLVIGLVVMVMLSGALVAKIGYYVPFMILSSVITPIGEGLLTTWNVNTTFSQWFGYQALTGMGVGLGMQQPMVAVQAALTTEDVPVATAIVVLMQTLGAAIFVSVGQSVFENQLLKNLAAVIPPGTFEASGLLQTGATDIWTRVPSELLPTVLVAYNNALTKVFTVAICMSALTMIGSLSMEWKSVKKGTKKVTEIEKRPVETFKSEEEEGMKNEC